MESLPKTLDRIYESVTKAAQAAAAPTKAQPVFTSTPNASTGKAGTGRAGTAPIGSPPPGSPAASTEPWTALEQITTLFGLTPFERDVLALLSGHTMESRFADTPTFALALATLEDPHWSALSSARPLRYWEFVSVDPGNLLHGTLRLDERILAYLMGMPAIDERLHPLIRPIRAAATAKPGATFTRAGETAGVRPADRAAIAAGTRHWSRPNAAHEPLLLIGPTRSARERAFVAICQGCELVPFGIDAADIPDSPAEREHLARLWTREAALRDAALYVRTETGNPGPIASAISFLTLLGAPVAVEVGPGGAAERLDGLRLHLTDLTAAEQKQIWAADLGPLAHELDGYLDRIAEYFHFDERAIRLSAATVREEATGEADPGAVAWRVCREHARRGLQSLATRVEPGAGWDDLVLPAPQLDVLRQVVLHVRHRAVVNGRWGFAARHARGIGLSALFAGASGCGKTMAAEVIAAELDLDLYKIDLATVVSKYIGETEKNLREIFTAAEESGAILLFDEADALFGKRGEVRDSHDRYANLEVSYLLQQMEAYRGVAILTTNMQHALDPAFMRRLRFVVQFPFPDAAARERIWQHIFPAATPLGELDFAALAQLNVTGGVIRNIATLAAYLAAADEGRVGPAHVLAAVRTEYAKTGRPLTAAETRGLT
jgi:hypothetical protein